jgi:uncharacterized membrane protein
MPQAELFHLLARAVELVGIGVIVLGAIVATVGYLRTLLPALDFQAGYHDYRANLGRAILLGLEFLVAADIIGTVAVEPTFRSLGVLALIVVVRTFLSFALELEVSGRWPWQRAGDRQSGAQTK